MLEKEIKEYSKVLLLIQKLIHLRYPSTRALTYGTRETKAELINLTQIIVAQKN